MLLDLLLENKDKPVTYEEIETQLYPNSEMSLDALRGLVKRVRKKLQGYTIKSVSGVGYILH